VTVIKVEEEGLAEGRGKVHLTVYTALPPICDILDPPKVATFNLCSADRRGW